MRTGCLPKKSHQRSQSTGCVPVRKAPTNPHSQASASRVQGRWGIRQLTEAGCQCPVHLARLRGKASWEPVTVLQYHAHLFHTRVPGLSSPTTEGILCGGDPPRGLSDETTSLGSWVQRWKGSQLQPFKPSHLDDFCSANNRLPEGQQGCGRTGRTARILNAPIASPTASQNDPKGW